MMKRMTWCGLLIVGVAAAPISARQDKQPVDLPKTIEVTQPVQPKLPLMPGDAAPALAPESWLAGSPVPTFEKGTTYVIEFWATWCPPCRESIPHLTEIQKKFNDRKVVVIGVDVSEAFDEKNVKQNVVSFIEKQGEKMKYAVAYDGPAMKTNAAYMDAAEKQGIPTAFIVNPDGLVAWIGHPMEMEPTLERVVAGKHDLKAARVASITSYEKERHAKDEEKKAKEALDRVRPLVTKYNKAQRSGKIDAALEALDEILAVDKSRYGEFLQKKFNILILRKHDYAGAYALRDALISHPELRTNALLLNDIAWMVADPNGSVPEKERNFDFAYAVAARAVEASNGEDGMILDTLAVCMWQKGEKKKALETQERAVTTLDGTIKKMKAENKGDSTGQIHNYEQVLGEMRERLDEYKKAIEKSAV